MLYPHLPVFSGMDSYRPPGSPSMRQRELILNAVAAQSPVLARKMGQARAAARAASP